MFPLPVEALDHKRVLFIGIVEADSRNASACTSTAVDAAVARQGADHAGQSETVQQPNTAHG